MFAPARALAVGTRPAGAFGRLGQALAAFAAGLMLTAAGASGPAALIAGVALGLPHGALDHLLARRLLGPRFGRAWPAVFGAAYLGMAGAVLAAWAIAPLTTLGAFLVASALHFGEEDAPAPGWAARVAFGALPILAPALLRPAEVERIFAAVAGTEAGPIMALTNGPALLAALASGAIAAARALGRNAWREPLIEAVVLVALFACTPPLVAFACYFTLVHTPRALDQLSAPGAPRTALLRQAAPLTALGLGLGLLLWLRQPGLDFPERTVRAAFHLLSALTAPHMLLRWLAARARPAPRRAIQLREPIFPRRR